jgi:hypothetical protein
MAWIASQQGLKDSHKLFDLMASMEWQQPLAVGHLQMLWWWCVDHAEDGDLSKFKPTHIAIAAGVSPSDSAKFVDAMIEAGFIDREPYLRLHDWWDHFGTFLKTKYKQRPEEWRKVERLYSDQDRTGPELDGGQGQGEGEEGARTEQPEGETSATLGQDQFNTGVTPVLDCSNTRQHNITKPNLTKPRESTPKPPAGDGGASPPGRSGDSQQSTSKARRESRAEVKALMAYPDGLQTDEFKAEFEEWIDHRMGLKKPGVRWSVFFQRQLDKELATLGPHVAFVTVRHSTVQGYTGLYSKANPNGRNRAPSEEEIDQTKF